MAISSDDVLKALLALDAYNRHSDFAKRKIGAPDESQLSAQIGSAHFERSSDVMEKQPNYDDLAGSDSVGFSASYYTINDTQTLISYRGTDFNTDSLAGIWDLVKDVGTGWLTSINGLGAGLLGIGERVEYV